MRRKLLVLGAALATALALAMPAVQAEEGSDARSQPVEVERGDYDSYIVIMRDAGLEAQIESGLSPSSARSRASAMEEEHDEVLRDEGIDTDEKVNDYVHAFSGFSALVTHDEAERLATNPKVARVIPDELRQPTTDSSPDFLGLTGPRGAWASGFTGAGVVVGVIDSGIWPEHPSFADNGLPAPPVSGIPCEFGNTAHNAADVPFTCNNKLVGARQMLATYRALVGADPGEFDSARDDDGHGTHTASTAAGNAGVQAEIFGIDYGTVTGIAPDAHVIAYKGLGALGGFTSDLAAAIDQAVADGVDVINYSIGGGSSPFIGADEISFLFAADAGVFVATSAGNSGPGSATLGSPGEVPWLTTVGANSQSRFLEGTVRITVQKDLSADDLPAPDDLNGLKRNRYETVTFSGASITHGVGSAPLVDAADAGDEFCAAGSLDPAVVSGAIVLCRRGAVNRVDKSLAVLLAGGVGMVHYNNDDNDNLFTDTHSVPSVHINNSDGLTIKGLIAGGGVQSAAIQTGDTEQLKSAPSTTYFSSRGPVLGLSADILKPDITAPGHQIMAGASPVHLGHVQGQLFQAISGTSMSSPHVAGLFALIKQAQPDWTAAMAKSALMTTADADVNSEDRSSAADPFDMGAGMVNPGGNQRGSAFQPGLVYDAGFNDYLGYLCDADPTVFSDPAGTCSLLESLGFATDASDLNLASIAVDGVPGVQTVTRTVTSVAGHTQRYRVSVDAPAGFDVDVSPSSITLGPGDTATYTVTFTTNGAPLGDWRFGSLEWRGGSYQVTSPIAVNAAALSAPDAVAGTGTDGSTSFDVLFGYTGDYTATPHGLAPDVGEAGTVIQDTTGAPTFDPVADVAEGSAIAHPFTLTGSLNLRITMNESDLTSVDPGNTDIDLFLFKDGVQIAASTAGGTAEAIEIASPDDGDYVLYVHGWQVVDPGPTGVGYQFHLWDVPEASGGSLVVDSAPSTATSGATETVEISWTGLDAGTVYRGAVTHGDGTSDLAVTFVEVDTN